MYSTIQVDYPRRRVDLVDIKIAQDAVFCESLSVLFQAVTWRGPQDKLD